MIIHPSTFAHVIRVCPFCLLFRPTGRILAKLLAQEFVSGVISTTLKENLSLQLDFWSIFHLLLKPINKRLLSLTSFSLFDSLLISHAGLGLNTKVSFFPSRKSLVVAGNQLSPIKTLVVPTTTQWTVHSSS